MSVSIVKLKSSLSLIAAAATLFAASAVQAAPGDPQGPLFPALDQPTGQQLTPAIARSAAGTSVVVWHDSAVNRIIARRFAGDGAPLDGGFTVAAGTDDEGVNAPDIAVDASGNIVIVWRFRNREGSGFRARRYTADGTAAGSVIAVDAAQPASEHSAPAVAISANGSFAVAFVRGNLRTDRERLQVVDQQVVVERHAADGRVIGNQTIAAQRRATSFDGYFPVFSRFTQAGVGVETGTNDILDVAMDDDGDYAVAWKDQEYVGARVANYPLGSFEPGLVISDLYLRRYGANGLPRGTTRRVAVGAELAIEGYGKTIAGGPRLAMAAGGEMVMSWLTEPRFGNAQPFEIHAQRYSDIGLPRGLDRIYAVSSNPFVKDVPVAINAAGDFALTWGENANAISARLIGSNGEPLSPVVAVGRGNGQFFYDPDIAIDGGGRFVVTWRTLADQTRPGPPTVLLRQFEGR